MGWCWWRDHVVGDPDVVATYDAAVARSEKNYAYEVQAGIAVPGAEETEEGLDLGDAVAEAEKHVPWWRR